MPLAITRAAWTDAVEWTEQTQQHKPGALQDEAGRLWDVITSTKYAMYAMLRERDENTKIVDLLRVPPTGDDIEAHLTSLRVHLGPGDNSEPVLTVSPPDED